MLSRTPAGGLSTFLAPMRKHDPNASTATGEPDSDGQTLNGIRIQRLKKTNSARNPSSPYASHTLEILTPPEKLIEPLLRIMAQLAKAYVCKASVALLFSCMEALGGVGYLYNEEQGYLNVSRVFRDTCVLPICEGTTDVLCTDRIRALKHLRGGRDRVTALEQVMRQVSRFWGKVDRPTGWDPERIWTSWRARLEGASAGELMGEAREIVWALGDLLVGLLLFVDAGSDGSVVMREMLVRFLEEKAEMERRGRGRGSSADELGMDLRIVFDVEGGGGHG
ncbi:hypothetical protein E4U60_006347 [Claviceps pazoutovae]|uniref:Acyl-CoA dehydrogenase/oxidase C-terminal domain-containing protein n=1 Tax=Claviceps pazoutovae TaxID=1649127 RepID=A0A9P7MFT2_9HYPO|nr:hypothetical protein E4U60_006347 [Claviceps pazoutovae]